MEADKAQRIYFDESGFTGNNLLHPGQTIFSYGSVATSDEEAKDFVGYIVNKYSVQNGELKGCKLIKYNKGRKAIDEILKQFEGRVKVSVSDKKYALAGKFFEYIFEPCIAENNFLFYGINFHRFIANILYMEFAVRGAGAEQLFAEFERLMREQDARSLENLFSSSVHPENSPILTQIRAFAQHRIEDIGNELDSLPGEGAGKWILDLTDTALFSLLANWGLQYRQLTAVCDESKPLRHSQDIYNVMIDREDKHFFPIGDGDQPITFNLSGPIQLVSSHEVHGVQLADAIAAASVHACIGVDQYAKKWGEMLREIAIYGSLFPDLEHVDLTRLEVQRNAMVLMELHKRALRGGSLLDGMGAYISFISEALSHHPLEI